MAFRAKRLFQSYGLGQIKFDKTDVVIDCGANYADLWLTLRHKISPQNYITFEPGETEYAAIKMNAPNGIHNNIGLADKSGNAKFYLNEADADSSIVMPAKFTKEVNIQTISLSEYLMCNPISKIKLFKLEAEGFEPEILKGAMPILDKIEYIAIDGGYERGIKKEETFSHLTNVLASHGYKMQTIIFEWGRALFRRK